ncbi:MAG: hypothetical protein PHT07_21955 [Paludibacter sp.]|nr:hypothetical protein [Paludibacter sp.]
MKKMIFISVILLFSVGIQAQKKDTIPSSSGFAFPLGVKVIIRLEPIDSINFNYSVVKSENMTSVIDSENADKFLTKKLDADCLEFMFCVGTHGETEKQRSENYETLLILNNPTPFDLDYRADIQLPKKTEFKPTSVMTLFSHVKGKEIWPYQIALIGLHSFKKMVKNGKAD